MRTEAQFGEGLSEQIGFEPDRLVEAKAGREVLCRQERAERPDLAGKVVLVTGGASGIGEAIVRRFARQKSVVVFFDIKADEGIRLARELSDEGLTA